MMTLHPVRLQEAFRYMGMHSEPDKTMLSLAEACQKKLLALVMPRYTYRVFPISPTPEGILCEGSMLLLKGNDIAAHLSGCSQAALFCATLSAGADTAIRNASAEDVLAGMMTDAIASALIEQLCDGVEQEIPAAFPEIYPTWRFSPGYGDLPLTIQADFLCAINAEKRTGVSVSDGGMLIPTKSVTAIIGLSEHPIPKGKQGCAICHLSENCPYRAKGVHC